MPCISHSTILVSRESMQVTTQAVEPWRKSNVPLNQDVIGSLSGPMSLMFERQNNEDTDT